MTFINCGWNEIKLLSVREEQRLKEFKTKRVMTKYFPVRGGKSD
jgi:hypothetical protein